MNDHDAMDAINAVLEQNFRGQITAQETVNLIARITGENAMDYKENIK